MTFERRRAGKAKRRHLAKPPKWRIAWFLAKRPNHWLDLMRRTRVNLARILSPTAMGRGRDVAEKWAASVSVSCDEALMSLGLTHVERLVDAFPEELKQAEELEKGAGEGLGGGGSADMIYALCEGTGTRDAIETGVAYGFSSLAILASISKRTGRLISIDMEHPYLTDHELTGCAVPSNFRQYWTLLRLPDSVGLRRIKGKGSSFDFCHYDSDKSYEGRAASYKVLWDLLRPGGIFMSDDIGDNTAFRDFSLELDVKPIVVYAPGSGQAGSRYIGILRKANS